MYSQEHQTIARLTNELDELRQDNQSLRRALADSASTNVVAVERLAEFQVLADAATGWLDAEKNGNPPERAHYTKALVATTESYLERVRSRS